MKLLQNTQSDVHQGTQKNEAGATRVTRRSSSRFDFGKPTRFNCMKKVVNQDKEKKQSMWIRKPKDTLGTSNRAWASLDLPPHPHSKSSVIRFVGCAPPYPPVVTLIR